MPAGEEMFYFHGYSGPCPKPPLPAPSPARRVLVAEELLARLGEWSAPLMVKIEAIEGDQLKMVFRHPESSALRWLLRDATMGLCDDGDRLCAWLNHSPKSETEPAFLVICEPSGDDGEVTAEDAPFLTDEQRAHINGTIPHAQGFIEDVDTIIAAVEYVAALNNGIVATAPRLPVDVPPERARGCATKVPE
jgi:hypothetical protein